MGAAIFSIHDPDVQWADVAGIYIFAKSDQGQWQPIYVGQASSFKDRMANHERWAEAQRLGATHVLALIVPQQASRDGIERSLIQTFEPPLNQQLK